MKNMCVNPGVKKSQVAKLTSSLIGNCFSLDMKGLSLTNKTCKLGEIKPIKLETDLTEKDCFFNSFATGPRCPGC